MMDRQHLAKRTLDIFLRNFFSRPTVILTDGVTRAEKRLKALKRQEAHHEANERLLVEAAQRDPRRFAELYELHFHRVYAYVVKRVQNREEAEDITSDVFQQALAKIKVFEWRGVPFSAWLLRIAANAITDRWKRAARQTNEPLPDDLEDKSPRAKDIEKRAALFQMVESLPADQRRVVEMRFAEQKSIREIAQEIGRTEGAVKQLQFRALEKLRAQMEGADA
jgi:RNA polymerase sigma-70 factor (ECF subfamily)